MKGDDCCLVLKANYLFYVHLLASLLSLYAYVSFHEPGKRMVYFSMGFSCLYLVREFMREQSLCMLKVKNRTVFRKEILDFFSFVMYTFMFQGREWCIFQWVSLDCNRYDL